MVRGCGVIIKIILAIVICLMVLGIGILVGMDIQENCESGHWFNEEEEKNGKRKE